MRKLLYPVFRPHQKFPFKLQDRLSTDHNLLIISLVYVSFSKRGCDVCRLLIYPLGIILTSPPPPPLPSPSCWITLEKFFVFGIVEQLGRQAEHGLGNGALGESNTRLALATMLEVNRLLSMAPAAQAEQKSMSEGAGKTGWPTGCTAPRFSPLNGAFAN